MSTYNEFGLETPSMIAWQLTSTIRLYIETDSRQVDSNSVKEAYELIEKLDKYQISIIPDVDFVAPDTVTPSATSFSIHLTEKPLSVNQPKEPQS